MTSALGMGREGSARLGHGQKQERKEASVSEILALPSTSPWVMEGDGKAQRTREILPDADTEGLQREHTPFPASSHLRLRDAARKPSLGSSEASPHADQHRQSWDLGSQAHPFLSGPAQGCPFVYPGSWEGQAVWGPTTATEWTQHTGVVSAPRTHCSHQRSCEHLVPRLPSGR